MSNKNDASSHRSAIGYTASSLILIFFLGHLFVTQKKTLADSALSYLLKPIFMFQNALVTPFNKAIEYYDDYKKLQVECSHYKELYYATHGALVEEKAKQRFNEKTEHLTQFQSRYEKSQARLCTVLVQRLSSAEQVFIVDAGSRHGIQKDMLAVYGSCLIGKVHEVFPTYSILILVTDKRSRVSIYCSQTKTEGIAEGTNKNNTISVTYINHLTELKKNDLMISSGKGILFPEGFGVGVIDEFTPSDLHYVVTAHPCYDLQSLEYCYIIAPEKCSLTPLIHHE